MSKSLLQGVLQDEIKSTGGPFLCPRACAYDVGRRVGARTPHTGMSCLLLLRRQRPQVQGAPAQPGVEAQTLYLAPSAFRDGDLWDALRAAELQDVSLSLRAQGTTRST